MNPATNDATMQPAGNRRRAMCAMCRQPLYVSSSDRGGRRCCSHECREEKRQEERRNVADRMRHDPYYRKARLSWLRKNARSWGNRSASPEEATPMVLGVPRGGEAAAGTVVRDRSRVAVLEVSCFNAAPSGRQIPTNHEATT